MFWIIVALIALAIIVQSRVSAYLSNSPTVVSNLPAPQCQDCPVIFIQPGEISVNWVLADGDDTYFMSDRIETEYGVTGL